MKRTRKSVKAEDPKNKGDAVESLEISSIEKDSFFQEDQYSSHGNPLHSTAVEEDLSPGASQHKRSDSEETGPRRSTGKTQNSVPIKNPRRGMTASKENRKPSEPGPAPTVRKAQGGALPTIMEHREDPGKKKASLTNANQKGQRSAKVTSLTPAEEQRRSSPEELTDEDESFHPSKQKSKKRRTSSSQRQSGRKHKRKSFSKSAGPAKRARDLRNPSDLEVVLNAFQEFVSQYKQTVSSDTVKSTIDAFSRSVEEQLSEIITETRELKNIKRENAKLNNAINQKRTRLLEANNDFIRGQAKLTSLQKEHDELAQRLKSLREGTSLLHNLQDLNRRYLDHRTAHPDEEETYGPSCLPAMLFEARSIMGTEQQLKNVNDQLQQIVDSTQD